MTMLESMLSSITNDSGAGEIAHWLEALYTLAEDPAHTW